MQIRPFQAEDIPPYESWFDDPVLYAQLGPMDRYWLEQVLKDADKAHVATCWWRWWGFACPPRRIRITSLPTSPCARSYAVLASGAK